MTLSKQLKHDPYMNHKIFIMPILIMQQLLINKSSSANNTFLHITILLAPSIFSSSHAYANMCT